MACRSAACDGEPPREMRVALAVAREHPGRRLRHQLSRRPNVKRALPAITDTYCLPSTM
jgi:hypothetical protein